MAGGRYALVETAISGGGSVGDPPKIIWDKSPMLIDTSSGQTWILALRGDKWLEWTPLGFASGKAPKPPIG